MIAMVVPVELNAELLQKLIPSPEAVACLSESVARRFQCIPLSLERLSDHSKSKLLLITSVPPDTAFQERIYRQLPAGVVAAYICVENAPIEQALDKCYVEESYGDVLIKECDHLSPGSAIQISEPNRVVRLVEAILRRAYLLGVSDIHVASSYNYLSVRFRIDGVLKQFAKLHIEFTDAFAGRIKILAALDIAETRLPQDGQFIQFVEGKKVDFRVSLFPIVSGENIVIRLLGVAVDAAQLSNTIYSEKVRTELLECLHHPDGLIVFCGPTGSGKSTSLYALIAELDPYALNIMTLEDPVEIVMPEVRQTSIDRSREFGYAEGLRAMLRQDPDVILVGEVRDSQSASMMLRASMTGHRVLTTVHASDSFSAIDRLLDLGASRELLSQHLRCIVSQRLVRKTCPQCLDRINIDCVCQGTRYLGRQAITELLRITPAIAALIRANECKEGLLLEARANGYESLPEQAKYFLEKKLTDTDELQRVLGPEAPIS